MKKLSISLFFLSIFMISHSNLQCDIWKSMDKSISKVADDVGKGLEGVGKDINEAMTIEKGAVGSPCKHDGYCRSNLCVDKLCKKCNPAKNMADKSDSQYHCSSNRYCAYDGHCKEKKEDGDTCDVGTQHKFNTNPRTYALGDSCKSGKCDQSGKCSQEGQERVNIKNINKN